MRVSLLALLALASCQTALYQSGDLRCAATPPQCPDGFHCAADDTCWVDGEDPDLAVAPRDMAAPDLRIVFDLTADDSGCAVIDPASCCGTAFTLCGAQVDCTGTCTGAEVCGGAFPNQCGCPAATGRSGIYRAVASDGSVCYSAGDPGLCPGFTLDATPQFYVYAGDPMPGMTQLLRCHDGAFYTLTFDNNCSGSATAIQDVAFGYIPATAACSSVALHAFQTTASGVVYVFNTADAPTGSTEIPPPFYVWTN